MTASRLTYRVTTTRTPVAEQSNAPLCGPQTSDAELVVLFADTWHSVREGAVEHVVEFEAARSHYIDHEAGTVLTKDLHAEVAFREAEVENRLMILGVLEAGGANAGTRVDTEASLGIEAQPPERPRFRRPLLGRKERWLLGMQEVARHEASEHAVSPKSLRRWLAHDVMIHPRLADEVAREGRVPARLSYRLRLIPELYERSLVLAAVEDVELELMAALRDRSPAPPHDEVHARVRAMLDAPPRELQDRKSLGRTAFAAGRYLDALLWFIAHSIATTDDCAEDVLALRDEVPEKSIAKGFMLSMMAIGQGEHLERVVAFLDDVEREAGPLGHVVGIMRSNALVNLASREKDGQRRAELLGRAREGFVRAIDADPGLAGVYKDLGDLYIGDFHMEVAWDLWALGRALAPGHRILSDIDAYERHLREVHPQFF